MTDNGKLLFELLHGKTLSALANEMGINVSNLSRVLNGKGCTKSMAERLNKYFGITNGGFVEEKREYNTEKEKVVKKSNQNVNSSVSNSFIPKYEIGQFVLYTNGKVGQIRKVVYNNYTNKFEYKVRLVEWCRPKEYIDHQQQYNILDSFDEKQITIIKKEEILNYKIKYEKSKKETINSNVLKDKKLQSIVDEMTIKNDLDVLLKEWQKDLPFTNVSNLTSDEKLVILKQIIYKLLTII